MGKHKHTSASHPYYRHWSAMRALIIIGAIVTILFAILWMIPQTNNAHTWFGTFSISEVIWLVVWGIVHIVLAIGLLSGAGAVSKKKIHIICSWIMLIIVGLVIVLPTANWGGVIVVIAGVIGIFDRLD